MKRKLALLALVLLSLTFVLTACNQPDPTEVKIRWDISGENHLFEITLADFSDNMSFVSYPLDNDIYYKDLSVSNEVFSSSDQVLPQDVTGTYSLSIQPSADGTTSCDVSATQVVYAQYLTSDLKDSVSQLQSCIVTGDSNPLGDKEDCTTLKSTTTTEVRFTNDPSQTPISSSTEVDGFYIGKTYQGKSQYKVSTTYNFEGKRPIATVTINDDPAVEYELPKNSAGRIIDSNQILVYVRTLEKSSTSFQDSPSVYVFDPYTHETQVANFGFTYQQNVVLTDNTRSAEETTLYTKLSAVSVVVGNHAFMVTENLPARLLPLGLDFQTSPNGNYSKYTTVRFRVGYLAYEVAGYDDAIWQGLQDSLDKAD